MSVFGRCKLAGAQRLFVALILALIGTGLNAQTPATADTNPVFIGQWVLEFRHADRRVFGAIRSLSGTDIEYGSSAVLTIEPAADGITAHIAGSDVPLSIDGNQIEFDLARYDMGDFLRIDKFTGSLADGVMTGVYETTEANNPLPWMATRRDTPDSVSGAAPNPLDITGFWGWSRGIKKAQESLTDAARMVVENFSYMDDPNNRCVEIGLVRRLELSYSVLVENHEDYLVMLYTSGRPAFRYIYLDGRDFPDPLPELPLGYSIGHWEGTTLVVETQGFKRAFIDSSGRPMSEDSVLVEYYDVRNDGQAIDLQYTLHDPRNYVRPVSTLGVLYRETNIPRPPSVGCDPHSFYRSLNATGDWAEYVNRIQTRR